MPQHKDYTFSIVVPLFNEEENVYPLVDSILTAVRDHSGFLEIVLVNDGSTDRTTEVAQDCAMTFGKIRLIGHDSNKGLGAAIRTGLNASEGDFVLYTDADLPFDFAAIPELLEIAEDNCIVTGRRLNRGEGWRRLVLTKAYNLIIRLIFGVRHRDINFACKILPKKLIEDWRLGSEGSFIDAEMVLEARRLGFGVKDYPLVYLPRERGLSTLSRPSVIAFIVNEMLAYKFRLLIETVPTLEPPRRISILGE
jgi:glycosyltransferase involved in cell wall biosynthesis